MNVTTTTPKVYSSKEIREKLQTNDLWLTRAICVLYRFQTSLEQCAEQTIEENGVGFNGVDGPFLSSLAQKINKGYTLSPKQLSCARKAMLKYSGQLEKIQKGNQ